MRTLWLNLSARCLSWFTGRFNILLRPTLLPPRVYGAYPRSARPFHSYLGCPHCALRCCTTPVSMPGYWGSTPCCCQSWTGRRYPDLAIAVTPIYQTQDPRQYEARARVSVFVGWSLRVIRPLADLGPPRQGQARRENYVIIQSIKQTNARSRKMTLLAREGKVHRQPRASASNPPPG